MQENPTVWLFDLDNTLHDADAGIFHLINRAMTRYMARRLKLSESAASDLRQDYWHRYGATLAGLQIHHPEIDIAEFLRESHPIDAILTRLHGMADTENTLCRLNGRKAVFSNGPSFYVRAVAGALGLENCFDALFGTDDFGLLYKPNPQAYLNVCRLLDVPPECCIMVDDSADNLHQAKALGMKTVRFGAKSHALPFIDASVSDMAQLARYAETLSEHRQNHYNTPYPPKIRKNVMRKTFLILMTAAALLSGCAWETYQDGNGKTAVRQKYPAGTPVYYQDGSYSKNMNYNQYRPERHAVLPDQTDGSEQDVRGQNWQKPKFQNR